MDDRPQSLNTGSYRGSISEDQARDALAMLGIDYDRVHEVTLVRGVRGVSGSIKVLHRLPAANVSSTRDDIRIKPT